MQGFSLIIDKYKIIAEDEYNFKLTETRAKKSFRGKKGIGDKTITHGFFSTLPSALNKLTKLALLTKDELYTIEELKSAFNTLENNIKERFRDIKPNQFKKGVKL